MAKKRFSSVQWGKISSKLKSSGSRFGLIAEALHDSECFVALIRY